MPTLTVPGRPVPKARPRVGKNGAVYIPRRCRDYEAKVAALARKAFRAPYEGPVALSVKVYLAGPGGDLDNYVKSIADALNGVAWRDDGQVVRIKAEKRAAPRSEERAEITVRRLSF
ncbi:RusA family crossover junction endodeoxyribonuclease [Desulfovirgula thermocuniculi]|uniref:RusA family crossover junction endodeoxyribonuclease n=1 Tax=Desulfovirgula thermocuniculi TaxID=348842 RepID=UPI000489DF73|nr:RusA family crossover junction endodeoxyribonuclease [Desulfovirgula thermocuniculi]